MIPGKMRILIILILLGAILLISSCSANSPRTTEQARIFEAQLFSRLDASIGSSKERATQDQAFQSLRDAFVRANPGYDLEWIPSVTRVTASHRPRVLFVQGGEAVCSLSAKTGQADLTSEVAVGDLIHLAAGQALRATSPIDLLVFTSPEPFPADHPAFIRPDHDPLITDTPGGCAEEEEAYRRILLTWKSEVGPYTYHALNAHRVRIVDSFTHYHPVRGGFDEFYLVQETRPDARVLTSVQTARIEEPESVDKAEAKSLFTSRPLAVGDLIYLPRGTVHRGLGGAVVQVITVPGFVPEREIGVDHHLRRIAEVHSLDQSELPFRRASSDTALTK